MVERVAVGSPLKVVSVGVAAVRPIKRTIVAVLVIIAWATIEIGSSRWLVILLVESWVVLLIIWLGLVVLPILLGVLLPGGRVIAIGSPLHAGVIFHIVRVDCHVHVALSELIAIVVHYDLRLVVPLLLPSILVIEASSLAAAITAVVVASSCLASKII